MKVLLLMFLVMGNGKQMETIKIETTSMPDCELLSTYLLDTTSVDPAFEYVKVSVKCVRVS